MGSSGPGTCRIMKVKYGDKTYLIQEDFRLSEYQSTNGRRPGYPIEASVDLSEDANNDCGKYIAAYAKLQEAQIEFEKAKEAFSNSYGGETLQKYLTPQKSPLPIDQVIASEDVDALKKLVEEAIGPDNTITKIKPSVEGYSIGMITCKVNKRIPVKDIASIRYGDYEWSKYDYKTKCITFVSDITDTFVFVKKGGFQYPPFRTDDYNEIIRK